MTTPTARQPETGLISNYIIGVPVTRAHGLRMVNDISYLLACVGAQPIHRGYLRVNSFITANPVTVPVRYNRSPGIQAVFVELDLYGETNNAMGTVSVAVSAGSISWIVQGKLDGSTELECIYQAQPRSSHPRIQAVIDVTSLTVGTSCEIAFTFTPTRGSAYGIRYLQLTEVPVPATDPQGNPTTETGLDAAWPAQSNRLIQGSSTVSRGIRRYVAQLLRAKTESRRHVQVTTNDDVLTTWSDNVGTWFNPHASTLRMRSRRVYSTSTTNRYKLEVTYRTSDGATTGSFRISDGTGTTTITGAAASTTRTMTSATFSTLTSTANQEVDLTFEMKRESGAGTVYLVGWALIEDEV